MAVLRATSGISFTLPDRCIVGRSRDCDLVLAAHDVSGQHALLQWTGRHWELQDLGSRNGTAVNAVLVAAGTRTPVPPQTNLRFGQVEQWTLVDAGPPQLMALRLDTRELRLAEGGLLALPDAPDLAATIYQDPGGAWVCERRGKSTVLADRAIVSIGDVAWKVYLPAAFQATSRGDGGLLRVAFLHLRIAFSRDEEHIEALVTADNHKIDLQARAHHYLLLLLARQRLADREAGAPETEQGWIYQNDLLRMLRMDEYHLNMTVYRARTQFGRIGVVDAASLIERRSDSRQLRIGVGHLELVQLG